MKSVDTRRPPPPATVTPSPPAESCSAGRTTESSGHTCEFDRAGGERADLERIFKPLSGKPDVWYCTHIELFDYEAARNRVVIAANIKSAYNPSVVKASIKADNKIVDVPAGKTVRLDII